MARNRLTDAKIKALPSKDSSYLAPDPECPGLYVRVLPSGAKSFTIVARNPHRKQIWREVSGTAVGVDSLADVRPKAREAIKHIKAGEDPFPPPRVAKSFRTVAEAFIADRESGKGLRSKKHIESLLARYVYPAWENRDFESIRRADVSELLDSITKDCSARRADSALAILRMIFRWYRARNENYRLPVSSAMMKTKPEDHERRRVLSDDEIRLIWPLCDGWPFGGLVRLLLLTGQRRAKVASMRWDDIDDAAGVWTIRSERGEKPNAESLTLPAMALDVIRAQTAVEGNPYIFPGRGNCHFNSFSDGMEELRARIASALQKEGLDPLPHWILHDLRRTAKTLMARARVWPHISERVLGHKMRKIERRYDQHDYESDKKDALETLAAEVESIINPPPSNVTVLRR